MSLSIEQLLAAIDKETKRRLHPSEAADLELALSRRPMTVLGAIINEQINGQLNRLATIRLGEEGAMLEASRVQGVIQGLRQFFEIAVELVGDTEEAERK